MLARAEFSQRRKTSQALSARSVIRLASKMPYPLFHRVLAGLARAQTWLRYPLWALNTRDAIEEAFDELDPDGSRLGLTDSVRGRFLRNYFYNEVADLATLLLYVDRPRFRRKALRIEDSDLIPKERESGPGVIVAGFRIGAYAALPWALGTLNVPVLMIVGDSDFARMGRELSETFAPRASESLTFVRARDPLVLARSQSVLNAGGIVSTLVDLSPIEYEKTTEVRLFGVPMQVAYGLPYLSAVTERNIVPAAFTRADGPAYALRFGAALPPPVRGSGPVREATQRLYDELERMVRRFPDQWIGWGTLRAAAQGVQEVGSAARTMSLT